ncbi:uncharacterized protein ACWYII_039690 isoform 1-T2 [Salvelinus alpinus]
MEVSHISFSYPVSVTVHDPPPPRLTVSSTVIRERDSVQLNCQTLPSVTMSQCYFYIEGRCINLPDSSCTQTLTGTELLKRADQTFPAVVKMTCYYAVGRSHTSPFSHPVSVTLQETLDFLWRHILNVLVLLATCGVIIHYVISHQCPIAVPKRSRRVDQSNEDFSLTVC